LADTSTPRADPPDSTAPLALSRWQRVMLALMVVGYAGYYLCRAHFSVSTPLLIKEFGSQGIDKAAIGRIASLGTLFYAFGKFINGSLADYLGGKRMFLLGMGGAVCFSLLFGLSGGIPLFTLAWVGNRLLQSTGWVGMVKLSSRWYAYSTYGAVMGIISLSYLFGDFLSRQFLGELISQGVGWRGVFFTAASILGVIFLVSLVLVKESPSAVGEPEPMANPDNVFGEAGQHAEPTGLRDLLMPLLSNPVFWAVCALSFGFTLLRETFNNWTPDYLTEVAKMNAGDAAKASSYFPLLGGFSVLLAGYMSDRLGRAGRAALILSGLILTIPALLVFAYVHFGASTLLPVITLGTVAFLMLGPYSLLAGAIGMDFGGKRGSATACGWIDGVGYVGGTFAGEGIGRIAQSQGWSAAFLTLAGVAALTCIAAAYYWWKQSRPSFKEVLTAYDQEANS